MSPKQVHVYQLNGCNKCLANVLTLDSDYEVIIHAEKNGEVVSGQIAVITGYATDDDQDWLNKIKKNSSQVFLFGSCPVTGGIFGLGNQKGEKIIPVGKVIKADQEIAGCLPSIKRVKTLFDLRC